MKSANQYIPPVDDADIEGIKREEESETHRGKLKHSIDFKVKEGKPVKASCPGEVVYVKDDSNIGGPDKKYWNEGNAIVIRHENGEFTRYEHLQFGSAKVRRGDKVKEGQEIALSGNTGYSTAPHVHFQVFRITGPNSDEDFETLKVNFRNKEGKLAETTGLLAILSLLASILFIKGITGNVIGKINNKFIGMLLFITGIALSYLYFRIKKFN